MKVAGGTPGRKTCKMPAHYLSRAEVADLIGVKPATLDRYRLPDPDATIGTTRGWRKSTIVKWHEARPGSPVPNSPGKTATPR